MRFTALRGARARVLAYAGGLPAVAAARVARAGGSRRRRYVLVVAVVGAAVLSVASVAQYPLVIADTASGWILGGRSDALGRAVPQICVAPPRASVSAAAVPAGVDRGGPEPVSSAPAVGLDVEGRPSAAALAVIDSVPVGVDIDVAQGWVLFGLAHPSGVGAHSAAADFDTFTRWYAGTAAILSPEAAPLDVVASIDPRADYSPYVLLSQVAAYQMMRQGSVEFSDEQRAALLLAIASTCRGVGGGAGRARGSS